jgi:neural Wiskott-Aldrich syndrome protein
MYSLCRSTLKYTLLTFQQPPRFAAPPPFPDAGKYAHINDKAPSRLHSTSVSNQGPPPPPRPSKQPLDDYEPGESGSRFGVPPPFTGPRITAAPPTPHRSQVPPPPPVREVQPPQPPRPHAVPPAPTFSAPPLPPKTPSAPSSAAPPLPPSSSRPVPPPPARESAPHPPPLPQSSAPSIPAFTGGPPPPPPPPPGGLDGHPAPPPRPPPSSGFNGAPAPPPPPPPGHANGAPAPPPPPPPGHANGPPAPPPPPPNRDSGYASGVPSIPPAPTGDRANLLAGIQKAGGIGSLKKVDPSQVRDRSGAVVPGSADTGPAGSGLPPARVSSGGGSVMDSLAAALAERNKKVSASGKCICLIPYLARSY